MGGKGGPQALYKPKSTGVLESAMFGTAIGDLLKTNPALGSLFQSPEAIKSLASMGLSPEMIGKMGSNTQAVDYNGLMRQANALPTGQIKPTVSAQNDPNFQFKEPGSAFKFNAPGYESFQFKPDQIQGVNNDVYARQRDQAFEDISRQQKQAGQAAQVALGKTGLGRSGFVSGAQDSIARSGREAMATASRNIGERQATSGLDLAKYQSGLNFQGQQAQAQENKFQSELSRWQQQNQASENLSRSGLNLQTQQAQAGENLSRSGLNLQNASTLYNQAQTSQDSEFQKLLQKIGLSGSLQQQASQQSNLPYQMLSQLYGTNIGTPVVAGGKGDPFSAILGAGASIAPMFCLPNGTMIDLEDGTQKDIREIKVGDRVLGGEVIATVTKRRHEGHRFYIHEFRNGKAVVMSFGHPFFEEIERIGPCEHDSPYTNDILTDSGHYFSNGCKLGSTIR